MALAAGHRLGPYEIVGALGAGGMGEVYRATDTNLKRQVAIKVLPEAVASDAERLSRFQREAQILASLNHPNIGAIYGLERAEGVMAIVMELVEGETLAQRLAAGPGLQASEKALPLNEALTIALQIAGALEAAHQQGIVHRDLKPANIQIRRDGTVKVLDFGLAKPVGHMAGAPEVSQVATATIAGTEQGLILGTAPYMSPEQARGVSVNHHTDIWAFGCVLYEMLAGRPAFGRDTVSETLAAILERDPDWNLLPRSTPATIRQLLRRCLEKDPAERLDDIVDARIEVEAALAASAGTRAPGRAQMARVTRAAAALVIVGLAIGLFLRQPQSSETVRRLSTGGPASASQEANEAFELAMQFQRVQNDLARAQQTLERALQLDPRFAEALRFHAANYAILLLNGYSNDTSLLYRAEEELREASQLEPNLVSLPAAFATVYLAQGRKELIPWDRLDWALEQDPSNVNNRLWRGIAIWLSGDAVSAMEEFRGALEHEPLFGAARMFLAATLREEGDLPGAIREMEKVLEQAPSNISAISWMTSFYLDGSEVEKARTLLESRRPLFADNYLWRQAWALLLAVEGSREEAMAAMDEETLKFAAAAFPTTLGVAEFYAVIGDASRALEWLERTVRNGDERAGWFRRNPRLAGLRDDPRFARIIASVESRRTVKPR